MGRAGQSTQLLEVEDAKELNKREDVRLLTIYKQCWCQWSVFGLLLTSNGHFWSRKDARMWSFFPIGSVL